jgi:NAD-dependent protein deacetylase/lipoamidase
MEPLHISPALCERIRTAERAVVFSGAGVSRESGLDTFRGAGGLWEKMRPEELATPQAFHHDPGKVWSWYGWRYDRATAVQPNPAHLALVEWEELFPEFLLVTQNVDGLHRRAGTRSLLELHGTLLRARCERCGRTRDMGEALAESREEPPVCSCSGRFRPAVVWFGESLDASVLSRAYEEASGCDLFVSVGTSSTVYPAAGLIEVAHRGGACLIEVNPEPTPFSPLADLRIAAPAGEALPRLTEEVRRCRLSA